MSNDDTDQCSRCRRAIYRDTNGTWRHDHHDRDLICKASPSL